MDPVRRGLPDNRYVRMSEGGRDSVKVFRNLLIR